jgi:hypothetical protein
MGEGENRAPEVKQGLLLDVFLGFEKRRPLEQAEAQIDGGSVQCVDRIIEIEFQVFVQINLASSTDQNCGQVGSDTPIARLVCIGHGGATNAVAKLHGVQLAQSGSKGHFDVSQALSPSQLCKSHDSKLLRARQAPQARIAAIAHHDSVKACS